MLFIENYLPLFQQQKANGLQTNVPLTFNGLITFAGGSVGNKGAVVDQTAAATLTAAQSGGTFLLDAAAGFTLNLPVPVVGIEYTFIVKTAITSNSYKILTDASTTFLGGQLDIAVSAGTAAYFFANGTTIRSINLNGTTTGGAAANNGRIIVKCVTSTMWLVDGIVEGSGTVATPFATS